MSKLQPVTPKSCKVTICAECGRGFDHWLWAPNLCPSCDMKRVSHLRRCTTNAKPPSEEG